MSDTELDFAGTGFPGMQAKLNELATRYPAKIEAAVRAESEMILEKAKQYAPEDSGALRLSGKVEITAGRGLRSLVGRFIGNGITAVISFGGPTAPYALAIHEYPSRHSPRSWKLTSYTGSRGGVHFRVGGPKFLERAIREGTRGMLSRLAGRLR